MAKNSFLFAPNLASSPWWFRPTGEGVSFIKPWRTRWYQNRDQFRTFKLPIQEPWALVFEGIRLINGGKARIQPRRARGIGLRCRISPVGGPIGDFGKHSKGSLGKMPRNLGQAGSEWAGWLSVQLEFLGREAQSGSIGPEGVWPGAQGAEGELVQGKLGRAVGRIEAEEFRTSD